MSRYLYYNQASPNRDHRPGAGISLNPSPRGTTVGRERIINMPLNDAEVEEDDSYFDDYDDDSLFWREPIMD